MGELSAGHKPVAYVTTHHVHAQRARTPGAGQRPVRIPVPSDEARLPINRTARGDPGGPGAALLVPRGCAPLGPSHPQLGRPQAHRDIPRERLRLSELTDTEGGARPAQPTPQVGGSFSQRKRKKTSPSLHKRHRCACHCIAKPKGLPLVPDLGRPASRELLF